MNLIVGGSEEGQWIRWSRRVGPDGTGGLFSDDVDPCVGSTAL